MGERAVTFEVAIGTIFRAGVETVFRANLLRNKFQCWSF
jgi:hypothetical protein